MPNYLIRLQLPDRPGALGAVASRIGAVGGDVVAIDILQRDNGTTQRAIGEAVNLSAPASDPPAIISRSAAPAMRVIAT